MAYFSRSPSGLDASALESEIQKILVVSRRNNSLAGVTGALLFNSSCFAQVIEGPGQAVEQTFERIQRDPRHCDITVLEMAETETREFPTWSMGFAGKPGADKCSFEEMSARRGDGYGMAAGTLYELLHKLILQEE